MPRGPITHSVREFEVSRRRLLRRLIHVPPRPIGTVEGDRTHLQGACVVPVGLISLELTRGLFACGQGERWECVRRVVVMWVGG